MKNRRVVGAQVTGPAQRFRRVRACRAARTAGLSWPYLELQHLHQELDIDQSAGPAFEIAVRGAGFQPVPHSTDRVDVAGLPGVPKAASAHGVPARSAAAGEP